MLGASGERQDGFIIQSERLITLGKRIENATVGGFDFGDLSRAGIDGLLGFDVIKEFHIEMNGPAGVRARQVRHLIRV